MKKAELRWMFVMILAMVGLTVQASGGTYAKISIDGSFCDWAGVPVLYTDDSGDGDPIDLATIQMANDESNLYIRLTYHTAVNPQSGAGTSLAIDNDSNPATGFDIFGLGLVGSEAGWQNDFPFAQSNGVFNAGDITGGAALIAPYNSTTTEQEYAIPRSATFTANGQPVFPGDSFALLVYTTDGTNDVAGPVSYTFAPEPPPVPAGTYAKITIDGSSCDWASVPVLYTDCADDGAPIDLATIQLANDDSNLYVRLTYYSAVNPQTGSGTFLAIDNDSNPATGFDVFGLGLVGSEAGWQNDFPFAQSNGVFNAGVIDNGGALISPYNTNTTVQEYAIPRSATFAADGQPVFPNASFNLLVYTDSATNDVAGPVSYTFAPKPPPTGTYANITIDGDFSDWIDVPVVYTDCSGDGDPVDFNTIQLANDESNMYVRLTYYTLVNPQTNSGVYLAFDTDNNPATGFDVFSLGLVGSEAGWENDFPFAQSNFVFNAGVIDDGGALISPYNTLATDQEYAIPRSATYDANGQLVFSGSSFTLLVYTVDGTADVAGPISYAFASPPVPAVDFRILSITRAANDISIQWMAPGGTTNAVQATNGSNGSYATNGFANISTNFVNSGSASVAVTNSYLDSSGATNKPARYYRIRQVP
jgi:hypothetical protein